MNDFRLSHVRTALMVGALSSCIAGTACDVAEPGDSAETPRGALLFELTEAEVEQIHLAYLADEPLQMTQARLTAPFNCALYDDFCRQVGRDAAIEITWQQVDLALDGATMEEIEQHVRAAIDEASDALSLAEDGRPDDFRSSGAWATRTKGDDRLRVRSGITTPLAGDRQAWTESKFQHQDWTGIWWATNGTEICVNAGTNTQTVDTTGGGVPPSHVVLESFNPAKDCDTSSSNHKDTTYHNRNTGFSGFGFDQWYTLTADGCGSGDIGSTHFGICANSHSRVY
ncbi:MAG: hypothetical protein K0V04_10000 [Deltaproteobacteria bacterium]|nr:hypothetical protein [Deltaproteobacteria bacterium]